MDNENLSFKEEKLFNFLFSKIIELQTEILAQQFLLKGIYTNLHPDQLASFEKMSKALEQQKPMLLKDSSQVFVAELKALSTDFEGMIESLIN